MLPLKHGKVTQGWTRKPTVLKESDSEYTAGCLGSWLGTWTSRITQERFSPVLQDLINYRYQHIQMLLLSSSQKCFLLEAQFRAAPWPHETTITTNTLTDLGAHTLVHTCSEKVNQGVFCPQSQKKRAGSQAPWTGPREARVISAEISWLARLRMTLSSSSESLRDWDTGMTSLLHLLLHGAFATGHQPWEGDLEHKPSCQFSKLDHTEESQECVVHVAYLPSTEPGKKKTQSLFPNLLFERSVDRNIRWLWKI